MSYIGANPSAADLRLTGAAGIRQATLLQLTVSATAPGTPAEGMVYYNDGTGTISEGLKVYKNGNFVSLDAQEGDADTLQLLQAKDQPTIKFNAAISSTSVVGNTLPVPIPTSTGTGGVGTFSVPSTGTDALMSNSDASRVFKYISHSTSSSQSDYWGVPLAIPKGFRGENVVLSFVYRTLTTSTTAMSDGQFKVYIQDKTNGKSVTSTSTGTITAGANINVSDRTGIGVGDLVYIETGTSAAGTPTNGITEAYVTSIDGSTGSGNITVSQTVALPGTGTPRIITKMLTDLTTSELKAAPSTAGSGEMKKIAFVPDSTCAEVYLWWQNTASTGSTKIDSLFYDQLLISSNKFLQIETRDESEYFIGGNFSLYSSSNARIPSILVTTANTGNKYFTFESDSTNGAKFTILEDCIVSADMTFQIASTSTGEYFGWSKNSTQLGTNILSITAADIISLEDPRGNVATTIGFTRRMAKGDVIRPHGGNTSTNYQNSTNWHCYFTATGIGGEQVVVQSENEVFSEWTTYTPTFTGFGTSPANVNFKWRRVGDEMEIRGFFTSATPTATPAKVSIPSGYSIDTNKCNANSQRDMLGMFGVMTSTSQYWSNTSGAMGIITRSTSDNGALYFGVTNAGATSITTQDGNALLASGSSITMEAKVPIVGWRAKFTPLLSMPLVDFTTWENTYSAYIPEAGTSVTSESQSFISSVTRPSTGVYTITFNSGHFSETPAVSAIAIKDRGTGTGAAVEALTQLKEVSASAVTVQVSNILNSTSGSTPENAPIMIVAQRQGADYKQPPQPTAAIIKPSVAYVKEVQDSTTGGGVTGIANTWHDRTLNTIEGESWFINSLTSNTFTLQPGQYEIESVQMLSQVDSWTSRLYNTTDSVLLAPASSNKASAGAYYANSHAKWVGTFAVATGIKLQYIVETASTGGDTLGVSAAAGHAAANMNSIYSQVKITKLK